VTNEDSFADIKQKWLGVNKELAPAEAVLFVVGNKNDLERKISAEDGAKVAKELKYEFMEVSAKNSTNVTELFTAIANKVVAKIIDKS